VAAHDPWTICKRLRPLMLSSISRLKTPKTMKSFDIHARGRRLAVSQWGVVQAGAPTWVLMHGGLDCTSTWKDLPERLHALTGLPVVSYDRYGHGRWPRSGGGCTATRSPDRRSERCWAPAASIGR
jgi:alpha-beta hydrolase superfamily lysophospholipase